MTPPDVDARFYSASAANAAHSALHRPWPLVPRPERRGYYYRARAWVVSDPLVREKLSPQLEANFRSIDRLGDAWGLHLDALGASYRMVRWVGAPKLQADREKRYRAVVAIFAEESEAPIGRRFLAVAASMPKVGRQAKRAERKS